MKYANNVQNKEETIMAIRRDFLKIKLKQKNHTLKFVVKLNESQYFKCLYQKRRKARTSLTQHAT